MIKHRGITFMLNIGQNGGVYIHNGYDSFRICLWNVAFTIFYHDIDYIIERYFDLGGDE